MAIDRAATRRTERMKGEAMGRRQGDNNGRIAQRCSGDGVTTMGERISDGVATGQ